MMQHRDFLQNVMAEQNDVFQRAVQDLRVLSELRNSTVGDDGVIPSIVPPRRFTAFPVRLGSDELEAPMVNPPKLEAMPGVPPDKVLPGTESDSSTTAAPGETITLTQTQQSSNLEELEAADRISEEVREDKVASKSSAPTHVTHLNSVPTAVSMDWRANVKEQYQRMLNTPKRHTLSVGSSVGEQRIMRCARLERIVNGDKFQCGACVMILLNACFIGYVVDVSVKEAFIDFDSQMGETRCETQQTEMEFSQAVHLFFTIFFSLELSVRFLVTQGFFLLRRGLALEPLRHRGSLW